IASARKQVRIDLVEQAVPLFVEQLVADGPVVPVVGVMTSRWIELIWPVSLRSSTLEDDVGPPIVYLLARPNASLRFYAKQSPDRIVCKLIATGTVSRASAPVYGVNNQRGGGEFFELKELRSRKNGP